MKLLSEFKQFAMRGNVIDLAVGVVIGTAFGRIVSSLVADVIMPPVGVLLAGVDLSDLAVNLGMGRDGEPVTLKYGLFLQAIVHFLIIAFAIFIAVKGINKLQRPPEPASPPPPPRNEVLLEEIRDLLKKQQGS